MLRQYREENGSNLRLDDLENAITFLKSNTNHELSYLLSDYILESNAIQNGELNYNGYYSDNFFGAKVEISDIKENFIIGRIVPITPWSKVRAGDMVFISKE